MAEIRITANGEQAEKEVSDLGKAFAKTDEEINKLTKDTNSYSKSNKALGGVLKGAGSLFKLYAVGVTTVYTALATLISYGVRANNKLDEFRGNTNTLDKQLATTKATFDAFATSISRPIYNGLIIGAKEINRLIGIASPKALSAFDKTIKSVMKSAVTSVGFVIKKVSDLIDIISLAINGYKQLANLAVDVGSSIGKTL